MSVRAMRTQCVLGAMLAVAAGCEGVDDLDGVDVDVDVDETTQAITGGSVARTCQFPTTVQLSGCTGTLIHPQIVVTAGHCGIDHRVAIFGELVNTPVSRVAIEYCRAYKRTGSETTLTDWAFCKLANAITAVPPTPPLMGCETEYIRIGQKVVIAGYGRTEADEGGLGVKRWVETTINRLDSGRGLQIGGNGKAPCYGDSGGPAYVKLADGSWRTLAIDSAGLGLSCMAGDLMSPMHRAVPWIERESGIDVSPCHDSNGNWNPSPSCRGFSTQPELEGRVWSNGCAEPAPSAPGATCGKPFDGTHSVPPAGGPLPGTDETGGTTGEPGAGGAGGGVPVQRPTISGSGAGCTCRAGGSPPAGAAAWWIVLVGLIATLRGRVKTPTSSRQKKPPASV